MKRCYTGNYSKILCVRTTGWKSETPSTYGMGHRPRTAVLQLFKATNWHHLYIFAHRLALLHRHYIFLWTTNNKCRVETWESVHKVCRCMSFAAKNAKQTESLLQVTITIIHSLTSFPKYFHRSLKIWNISPVSYCFYIYSYLLLSICTICTTEYNCMGWH